VENGYVSTENGNERKLDPNNENIWILSHFIQSKASLIFKKAIIETYNKVKNAELLIPLHDGALYEIDKSEAENTKSEIRKIYNQKLKIECSSLNNIQVKEHQFYEN
jgi:DNA polymerase I-like protein with 3'-5' exonuclease and polymerase domains